MDDMFVEGFSCHLGDQIKAEKEGVAHFNNQGAAESDVNPVCMGHAIEWERQDSVLAFVHGGEYGRHLRLT